MAIHSNLFVDQGSYYSAIVELVEQNSKTIIDLTNRGVIGAFRKYYESGTTYPILCSIYDKTAGLVLVEFPSEQTSAIKPGRYVFEIKTIDLVTNIKRRVLEGFLVIEPEIAISPNNSMCDLCKETEQTDPEGHTDEEILPWLVTPIT